MSQHYVNCQMCGSYSEFYCNECHQEMCGECRDKHLRHPDNSEHEVCRYKDRKLIFPSIPCKLHPKHQLTLCCENCQQAICALCTTKKHAGHVFLDLEEVYTKKCKTHIELICKIRDDVLPKSRRLLHESMDATLEIKGNLEMLRSSMKEQASQIKELVDTILTENLDDLQSYETSAVKKLENQEKVLFTYVTQMQLMLEGYQNSRPLENPLEFLFEMNDILKVKLEPIPGVPKISLGNFFHGKLNNEEIRKQFGVLTKPTNET